MFLGYKRAYTNIDHAYTLNSLATAACQITCREPSSSFSFVEARRASIVTMSTCSKKKKIHNLSVHEEEAGGS
jgi:hypothetical protein